MRVRLSRSSVSARSASRPYATLRAKGDDRKQRILAVAERLLRRATGDAIPH